MVVKGGKHKLVGFVDLGKIHHDMEILSGNYKWQKIEVIDHYFKSSLRVQALNKQKKIWII